MSPSRREREREYAKRRYEKWQAKQADRAERQRRARRNGYVAAGAAVAVVAVVAVVLTLTGGKGGTTTAAGSTSSTPTTSGTTSASPSASASTVPANDPCPKPSVQPPAKPQQFAAAPAASTAQGKTFLVTLKTSCGDVVLTLDGAKAPHAVASTVFLAQKGFYNGSICHRLTTSPGFGVLQCGDPTARPTTPTANGQGGPGYSYGPIENAPADAVYKAGTVAMARVGGNASSMGSQFFLVYEDTTIPADNAGGYTVMGTITKGLDIVQKIAKGGAAGNDGLPNWPISIVSTSVTAR